ncbi:MAG: 30S ribosomal protein S2 [Parcubacteria group bacterium]|nr:30S ribosomal protein S2 [Parcubacteria group bacterium]
MKEISMSDLLKVGAHFGHQTARWNPKMKSYVFGDRDGIHIIDVRQTVTKLKKALEYVAKVTKDSGKVLFVGTKKQAKDLTKKAAEDCAMPYVTERWLGGTFTNFGIIKKQIRKLVEYEEKEKSDEFTQYTKKEQIEFRKEQKRLTRNVGGLRKLDKLPECVFIIDIVSDKLAVKEARSSNIPIVALVDTNGDPNLVNYPIPTNDDAIKVIEMMTKVVSETIKKNYAEKTKPEDQQITKAKKVPAKK